MRTLTRQDYSVLLAKHPIVRYHITKSIYHALVKAETFFFTSTYISSQSYYGHYAVVIDMRKSNAFAVARLEWEA